MEFQVLQNQLAPALAKLTSLSKAQSIRPILGHTLIVARNGRLTLTGSDCEIEIETSCEADIALEGEITVSTRKLYNICRALNSDAQLQLKADDRWCIVASGAGRFSLSTLPTEDFPEMTVKDAASIAATVSGSVLRELLDKTANCMASQDAREMLNGLLLEIHPDGQLIGVATDGHRLAKYWTTLDQLDAIEGQLQAIIPNRAIKELKRLLADWQEPVEVMLGKRKIRFQVGDTALKAALIDSRYPDYDRVIPKENPRSGTIEVAAMKSALSRMDILAKSSKYPGIQLNFRKNTLQLAVENPDQEESEDEIDMIYEGDDVSIGFNINYLKDVLGAIKSDRMEIRFSDCVSSAVLRGKECENEIFVVMPMRI